jgi:hypothetical protein
LKLRLNCIKDEDNNTDETNFLCKNIKVKIDKQSDEKSDEYIVTDGCMCQRYTLH